MEQDLSRFTVHLLGNAHIDLVYRWRLNEVIERVAPDTFTGVLALMKRDPDFTFVQSQMALYQAMQEHHPELYRKIEEAVQDGRWAVVGGWAEYDHMLTGDESIIRHYLLGTQYMRAQGLAQRIVVDWCPDSFSGHAHTLPTIMAGCGIRYLLMIRATPQGMPAFIWEGPDGSQVLTCRAPLGYGIALSPSVLDVLPEWERVTGLTDVLVLYGMGDHGGGPRQGDLDALADMQSRPGAPRFVHSLPEPFFQTLGWRMAEAGERDGRSYVFRGELLDVSRGPFTSEGRNKRRIVALQHDLLTAERLASLSSLLQRKPVCPRVDFDRIWQALLRHQFHDDIPGTSRHPVYLDNEREYESIGREIEEIALTAMGEVGARLDTRGEGQPVIVFNPLAWERTGPALATLRMAEAPGRLAVVDESGGLQPAQVVSHHHEGPWHMVDVAFTAREVPPVGYRLYRVLEAVAVEPESDLRVGQSTIENQFLRVTMDERSGNVSSIFDKRRGVEVLSGPSNALQLLGEDPSKSSAWIMWPTGETEELDRADQVRLLEAGPARATLSASSYWRDSHFERQVTLCSGVPVVFFRCVCHWYEREAALKVAFRLDAPEAVATYDVPFGSIERPTNGQEVPAHRWADLSGPSGGAALLNRGCFGHDAEKGTLRLTLLRGIGDLDPLADEGEHEIVYALYPHAGGWQSAEVVRRGMEFNLPFVSRREMKRSGVISPWGAPGLKAALPPSLGLVEVGPANVVLTALKLEQGQWTRGALILRLYEAHGQETTACLRFPEPVALVQETNHLEESKAEGRVRWQDNEIALHFRPHEIRTIRVELAVYGLGLDTEACGDARGLENG
ncbi:MAG: alpha-mannosidase [Anaerolineae bacterium]|nr:alpha-mannosidase [Anaerolineae bacterium]